MKYYISFDTKDCSPAIRAVTVELKHELITNMDMPLPVNLSDDVLYEQLVKYVSANPPRRKK